MPLSDLKVSTTFQFTLAKPVTGWGPANQGPNAVTFKLGTVDFSAWDEAHGVQFDLGGAASVDLDLTALLNQLNESVSFTAVLALVVKCDPTVATAPNGALSVTPSLAFGFSAATSGLSLQPGGLALLALPTTSDGYTVDSTHKNITFSNTGTDSITVTFAVAGAT